MGVGVKVGLRVGRKDIDGAGVGVSVGRFVGDGVGCNVGIALGRDVGMAEGTGDGTSEGRELGTGVGEEDGKGVGSGMQGYSHPSTLAGCTREVVSTLSDTNSWASEWYSNFGSSATVVATRYQ